MEINNKYNYELIKDYLDGLLDNENAKRVRRIIADDEVARDIAKGILILEKHFSGNEDELDQYLDRQLNQRLGIISAKRVSMIWRAAAVVLLVVAAGFAVNYFTRDSLEKMLTAELQTPYAAPLVLRDAGDDPGAAMIAYSEGDYELAIKLFAGHDDPASTFFEGLSYLYIQKHQKAIELLSSARLKDSLFEEQARWFLALAYLKDRQLPQASALLTTISQTSGHFKQSMATRLLKKL